MSIEHLDVVPVNPSGVHSCGLEGRPTSMSGTGRLTESVEQRTVHETEMLLGTGELVTVRTLRLVFDRGAADLVVSESYRPPAWGTAVFTPAPENALLEMLCTYDDPDEAVSEHKEAMGMVALGTNEPGREPYWAEHLSWAGPGR
ncbi:hypothetical protein [Streptomyces sp. NPDC059080]|uniref:hypothetical protein n=1 Tax=Streptomyces sp. NPDC059080 TaxID=3346718 RepID=UPI0036A57C2C